MAKKIQVRSGCRDCKKCSNSSIDNAGRNAGRLGLGLMTGGLSEVAMAGTKNCNVCGHKLSLHEGESLAERLAARAAAARARADAAALAPNSRSSRRRAEKEKADATAEAPDYAVQLKQLAELRDAGILTEDEFAAKKAEILSRI